MLFMFLRFFSIFIFYPTRLKEINPDSTEDSIPDSNLRFLFPDVQQICQVFPSKSAFCSQVSFFFWVFCWVSVFQLFFILFLFCFSDLFFIFSCFLDLFFLITSCFFHVFPWFWSSVRNSEIHKVRFAGGFVSCGSMFWCHWKARNNGS